MKKILLTTLFTAMVLTLTYNIGYYLGEEKRISEYEKIINEGNALVKFFKDKNEELIKTHSEKELLLIQNLEELKENYEKTITDINSNYSNRLRQSEERSIVYRQQASSSVADRERLAIHAARLDRSLEEGRHLVKQLSETIRLREQEIINLGSIIQNDRKLLKE